MQTAMTWWCNLIGVTDPASIQIAVGIASVGAAIFVLYLANVIRGFILSLIITVVRDWSS